MNYLVVISLTLLTLIGGCKSQPRADEPVPEPVRALVDIPLEYTVGETQCRGQLFYLTNLERAPMILLLADERGIDEWIAQRGRQYAQMGYVVVCPDMRSLGSDARDADVRNHLEAALQRGRDSVRYAAEPRVGVLGWGLGGTHALTAVRTMDLTTAVICYGQLLTRPEALYDVEEPVLGIFGAADPVIPQTALVAFKEAMDQLGGRCEINIWQGEAHDFMRFPADPSNAHEAQVLITRWMDERLIPSL